ncbi:MAG: GTPase Era [Deltaproteobacteria bacterium]|nr:MAG: GTPase Era [Deltaproteobacteria bacterium]
MSDTIDIRAGFCAILGLPNAGKSTLLNAALGKKIAAVSPKPQTTRNRIVGIVNRPDAQVVFVDTPGVQHGHNALRKYMLDEALAAAVDCDVALLMLDASDPRQRAEDALERGAAVELWQALARLDAPAICALNKVDRLRDKALLLPWIESLSRLGRFEEIVPMSALRGTNVPELIAAIARQLPPGPRLFPEDMVTDRAESFLAAELIREQLYLQLGDELPYASAVVVEQFEERSGGDVAIYAVIYVERDSQRGIVVGRGGARIKEVGQRARAEIAKVLGCPVHVRLHVKVAPEWSSEPRGLRKMGYE